MMNDFDLTPDDPRITAYALNELEPAERASVEAAIRQNPELRAAVDEVRGTAARIEAALTEEAAEAPAAETKTRAFVAALPAALTRHRDEYAVVNGRDPRRTARRILRFPQLYYIVGGLAAAGFAVVVARRDPPPAAPAKKVYQLVELRPARSDPVAPEPGANEVTVALPTAATAEDASAPGRLSLLEQVRGNPPIAPAALPPPSMSLSTAVTAPAPTKLVPQPPATVAAGNDARKGEPAATRVAARSGRTGLQGQVGAVEREANATTGQAGGGAGVVTLQPFVVTENRESIGAALASTSMDVRGSGMAPYSLPDLDPGPRRRLPMPEISAPPPAVEHTTEAYSHIRDNDFLPAAQNPLSTFSIDVDTASYANVRRFVQRGRLPPADAVRIEELINYFPYRYAAPPATPGGTDATPFAASLEVAAAPWAPGHRLVRIGLKGREVAAEARPTANLVFLIDVSGSMNEPNKLPLVKDAMRLLLARLRSDDRVAIVTYAGQSGLALPSTPVARSREILDALDGLRPGGSTNGAMGIVLAYDIAKANFARDGVNRVILCTDGDFNIGVTSQGELVRLVEEKAQSGVFLTVLGFGMGNLKDATLESLADKGNGTYGYIDTHREAEKLLVEEMSGTLVTIAKDVKIQVDFNPAKVASYRLIGYENRALKKEDFGNDKVDAGEVGAGHTVTALYEIIPVGAADRSPVAQVEESKYQPRAVPAKLPAAIANELLTVRVRYKEPSGEVSRKIEFPLTDRGAGFEQASADFKFSSALAAFGMILRDSPHKGRATIGSVIEWALAGSSGAADDPRGYRREFLDLARQVQGLITRR